MHMVLSPKTIYGVFKNHSICLVVNYVLFYAFSYINGIISNKKYFIFVKNCISFCHQTLETALALFAKNLMLKMGLESYDEYSKKKYKNLKRNFDALSTFISCWCSLRWWLKGFVCWVDQNSCAIFYITVDKLFYFLICIHFMTNDRHSIMVSEKRWKF